MVPSIFRLLLGTMAVCLLPSCSNKAEEITGHRSSNYVEPNWEKFRSISFEQNEVEVPDGYAPAADRFIFADLKYESNESFARRLLGALSSRIVFIDRQQHRWKYYQSENDPIHSVTLFSQPEPWGSAFGLCRIERYEISFSSDGSIESVDVSPRYGVEGPIFQKDNFDWDRFRGSTCGEVPSAHTPSYFPVSDSVLDAQDLAILLSLAIDQAGRDGPLDYDLSCRSFSGEECEEGIRQYISTLRLNEINSVNKLNCERAPNEDCFTVTVGEHQLGPYPKLITIRGTTYMNDWQVYSVSVVESFTVS